MKCCETCNHSLENTGFPCTICYEFFHWEQIKTTTKYTNLLQKVDAEIEIAKAAMPIMAMGMAVVRLMIVKEMEDDKHE